LARRLAGLVVLAAIAASPVRGGDGPDAPFAQSVRVGEGGVVEGAAVVAAVRSAIAARLAGEEHEVEAAAGALRARPGAATLVVEAPAAADLAGPAVLHVTLQQGGRAIVVRAVPVTVHRFAELAVLARSVERGELITQDLVRLERAERPARAQAYASLAEVVGLRARRQLKAGAVVLRRDVEAPPLVRRGQAVRVVFERGALELELRGEALGDGWAGDRVRVRRGDLGTPVAGRVAGPGEIRLEL
jgi:flagella basal body P-ring formation protein FlgA